MVLTKNAIAIAASLGAGYFLSRLKSTNQLQIDASSLCSSSSGHPRRRPKLPSLDSPDDDERKKRGGDGRVVIDSSIRSAIMEQADHREDICTGGGEIDEMKDEINDLKKCVKSLQIDVTELNLEVQFQEFSRLVENETFARDEVEKGVRVAVDSEARLEISKLKEREMEVEMKLMEYNKNKEREIAELRTTVKTLVEYKEFKEKEKTAVAPVDDDVALELREAKQKIDVLRRKLRHKSRRAREMIAALQFKTAELQHRLEINSVSDKHHHHPMLEDEIAQLREVNSTLENDNTDLKHKLEFILTSNSESRNELKRQIDQLEIDKCSEIQKAVYLKWINACLRYELRHYQPPPGEATARDLSKSLSPKSAEKAKELIHVYARHDSNDEEITPFEVVEVEDVEKEEEEGPAATVDDKNDVSSMNDVHRSGKKPKLSSLGGKLRKLVTRRDSSVRSKGCFSDVSFSSGCKQSIASESPRARCKKTMLKTSESAEIKQLSHALKNNKADSTTKSPTHSRPSFQVEQEHESSTLFTSTAGA